jgi:hypothetical protein
MCTAEISNSASHVEQNRLHQHTIADLEAEVTTLTEQDRRHRQHIAVLEHKLQHSLTQSHKAAEPLKANAPQEPGSNTDQSPHSNEVKEQCVAKVHPSCCIPAVLQRVWRNEVAVH